MTPPPPYTKMPSVTVRRRCRELVIETAARYGIPPAFVTAHVRPVKAVAARREVMARMLGMGLTRSQVAMAFGRDLRRVRESEIGKADMPGKPTFRRRDYRRFDLFGAALEQPRTKVRTLRVSAAGTRKQLPTLLPDHPEMMELW